MIETSRPLFLGCLFLLAFVSCNSPNPSADTLLIGGTIYTNDTDKPLVEAIAVRDGRVVLAGTNEEVLALKNDTSEIIDVSNMYVYPGFTEGHAHILGVGSNILDVDLMNTKSYEEVIDLVKQRAAELPPGTWIVGRGWHQDKWEQTPERMFNGFPTHDPLSEAVPDHPVWIDHASGHAGLANARAMQIAGVTRDTPNPEGGEVFKNVSGQPTGLFNEMAYLLIYDFIPKDTKELLSQKLELAIDAYLSKGVTALHQAGSDSSAIAIFEEFASNEKLKLRLYVMLDGSDEKLLERYFKVGPRIGEYGHHLNIRSVKLYADGALGSRGAWLLEEYTDAKGVFGHSTTSLEELSSITDKALMNGFQVATHAIGDRANREVLDIYANAFERNPTISKDHRFRIEHAQHIHPDDIPRFGELAVIPALQAIHMSSDRPWAIDRLGRKRIEEGAYMWKSLIESGAIIVNGTDAPVEPIDPYASFYSSVTRKTLKGFPEGGYEPAQKMSREEALKSFTQWPAYSAFMEELTGVIEPGKLADFTVLDRDIMSIPEDEILDTEVIMTIIDGKVVFHR